MCREEAGGWGGAGDRTWPRRETDRRRNIKKGDRVVTMTPEDIIPCGVRKGSDKR